MRSSDIGTFQSTIRTFAFSMYCHHFMSKRINNTEMSNFADGCVVENNNANRSSWRLESSFQDFGRVIFMALIRIDFRFCGLLLFLFSRFRLDFSELCVQGIVYLRQGFDVGEKHCFFEFECAKFIFH